MTKTNEKTGQVIDDCMLCGEAYWQVDLIPIKQVQLDIKGKKSLGDIVICPVCKQSLDKHVGVSAVMRI